MKPNLSEDEELDIMREFVPYVSFHKKDIHMPCSVEWFLEGCALYWKNKKVLPYVGPNVDALLGQEQEGVP